MKKILAFTLCFVMMFTLVAQAMPSMETKVPGFTILSSQLDAKGAVTKEIGVYGDSLFYYEEVGNCRVSMELISTGTVYVYRALHNVKDEVQPVYEMGTFMLESSSWSAMTEEDKIAQLADLCKKVVSNEVKLSSVTITELGITPVASTRSGSSAVYDALEDQEGPEYSDQFLYGKDYRGEYGALYRSKTFQTSNYYSWFFAINTTLAAISVSTGFPVSSVSNALGSIVVGLVGGVTALLESADGDKYNANVLYEKDVKVNAQVVYTTEKCEYNFGLAFDDADAGDAQLKYRYTDTDSDYNDSNSSLVETGIDIYLENQN